MKSTWRSRLPMSKKSHQADQLVTKKKTSRLKNASEQDTAERTIAGKTRLRAKAENPYLTSDIISKEKKNMRSNGLRYPQVGGRGFCLGAGKTRSQKNARKCRRIPLVGCTLCWAAFCCSRLFGYKRPARKLD